MLCQISSEYCSFSFAVRINIIKHFLFVQMIFIAMKVHTLDIITALIHYSLGRKSIIFAIEKVICKSLFFVLFFQIQCKHLVHISRINNTDTVVRKLV